VRGILLLPVLGVVALAAAALDEDAGVWRWWHLRGELADARARIERLRGEVDALRDEAARLESDPFAVERAIREELLVARPGEVIVRVVETDRSSIRIP
jgi:cell division protein FtsB